MFNKKLDHKIDILIMSDNALDTVGGEQESTKIIIDGVKDKYNIGVIQPGNINNPTSGVHYYPMTNETRIKHLIKNPFSFVSYIMKVMKTVRREEPKVIHTQAQVSFFIIAMLRKLKFIPNQIKLIHTERGLYTKYSNMFKKIFFFFMKELNTLVTTTNFNMQYWKTNLENKVLSLNYKIIENTAGELFETYNPEYERSNSDQLIVGFAGRYADWKNWPLAVEISEKLNEALREKVRVNMAIGCLDEKAEKETIKMYQRMSSMLSDRFDGKINISLEEMNQFYYDIDIFILTSNRNTESFGRTLVEAMSRKTVVLSTDAGGSVEVVGDKNNICTTEDEFVKRVLSYYKNKNFMESKKVCNSEYVKEKYSLDNNIIKHLDLYNRLIY